MQMTETKKAAEAGQGTMQINMMNLYNIMDHVIRMGIESNFDQKKMKSVIIWGPPGIGKSQGIAQIAKKWGGKSFDLRCAQYDLTDIKGVPHVVYTDENGEHCKPFMDWAVSHEFPTEEEAAQYPIVILFFDEFTQAAAEVQAGMYQVIQDRRVGSTWKAPKNCFIVAASNKQADKGATTPMPVPLKNRFMHLYLRSDYKVWIAYARVNGIHPDVISFIEYKTDALNDPNAAQKPDDAFCTPRSWEFVSDLLWENQECSDGEMLAMIAGCVGLGIAREFMTQRSLAKDLPKTEDILAGKKGIDLSDENKSEATHKGSALHFMIVNSICYALKEVYDRVFGEIDGKYPGDQVEEDPEVIRTEGDEYWTKLDNGIWYIVKNVHSDLLMTTIAMITQTYEMEINPEYFSERVFSIMQGRIGFVRTAVGDLTGEEANAAVKDAIKQIPDEAAKQEKATGDESDYAKYAEDLNKAADGSNVEEQYGFSEESSDTDSTNEESSTDSTDSPDETGSSVTTTDDTNVQP